MMRFASALRKGEAYSDAARGLGSRGVTFDCRRIAKSFGVNTPERLKLMSSW